MLLTYELLRKLKSPINYTLPKGHLSPRERILKWTGKIKVHEGLRHENLKDAALFFQNQKQKRQLDDFEKIIVVVRNPYDYIVSRFHYLQLKKKSGPAGSVAQKGDFENYVLNAPRFFKTEDFLLNEKGSQPENLSIVRYENLSSEMNELLKSDLKEPLDFNWRANTTKRKNFESYISSQEIEHAIYNKFTYLFDNAFYNRIELS